MIATRTHEATTVYHSWAANAERCALARAEEARAICGTVWVGGSIGFLSTRNAADGADPAAYARYEGEAETAAILALTRRWYAGAEGLPIGPDGLPNRR
jgi:hypothetical protein